MNGHLKIDDSRCIRCFSCVDSCEGALKIENLHEPPIWNEEECIFCFRCIDVCQNEAISFDN